MKHSHPQTTSLVPVYYWRGARPSLIDLDAHQTGWLVCLSLTREGDSCLLPLAWQADSVPDSQQPDQTIPVITTATTALDSTAVTLTLHDLQQVGWEINGRLTIQFTGQDADPHFTETNNSYLWHTPQPSSAPQNPNS